MDVKLTMIISFNKDSVVHSYLHDTCHDSHDACHVNVSSVYLLSVLNRGHIFHKDS